MDAERWGNKRVVDALLKAGADKSAKDREGRGLEYYDKCAVEDICNELKANDYRFTALLNGVISSKPFLMSNTKMENDE